MLLHKQPSSELFLTQFACIFSRVPRFTSSPEFRIVYYPCVTTLPHAGRWEGWEWKSPPAPRPRPDLGVFSYESSQVHPCTFRETLWTEAFVSSHGGERGIAAKALHSGGVRAYGAGAGECTNTPTRGDFRAYATRNSAEQLAFEVERSLGCAREGALGFMSLSRRAIYIETNLQGYH